MHQASRAGPRPARSSPMFGRESASRNRPTLGCMKHDCFLHAGTTGIHNYGRRNMKRHVLGLLAAAITIGAEAQQVSCHVKGVIAGDFLNMREGPAITYRVIQRLENGVDGIVLIGKPVTKRNTEWQKINSRGIVGWVNAEYLARSNTHSDTQQSVMLHTPALPRISSSVPVPPRPRAPAITRAAAPTPRIQPLPSAVKRPMPVPVDTYLQLLPPPRERRWFCCF